MRRFNRVIFICAGTVVVFCVAFTAHASAMTPSLHPDDAIFQNIVRQAQPFTQTPSRAFLETVAQHSADIAAGLPDHRTDLLTQQIHNLARERFIGENAIIPIGDFQQQQQREAAQQQSRDRNSDLSNYYLNLPECVDAPGLLFSTNLFLFWTGGAVSNFGNYNLCQNTPNHRWCMMDTKLMCVKLKNTTGKANVTLTDLFDFAKYEDMNGGRNLACNGQHSSLSSGICYNTTQCPNSDEDGYNATNGVTNFTASLFRWSLDHRNLASSRTFFYPLCVAIEKGMNKDSNPFYGDELNAAPCNVNYSFFYVEPWCDVQNPTKGTGLDDASAQAFLVCCTVLVALCAFATLIGFLRRAYRAIVVDFFDSNEKKANNVIAARLQGGGGGAASSASSSSELSRHRDESANHHHPPIELQERLLEPQHSSYVSPPVVSASSASSSVVDPTASPTRADEGAVEREGFSTRQIALSSPLGAINNSDGGRFDDDDGEEDRAATQHREREISPSSSATTQPGEVTHAVFQRTGMSMGVFASTVSVANAGMVSSSSSSAARSSKSKNGGGDDEPEDNSLLGYAKSFLDAFDFISAFTEFMQISRSEIPTAFFDGVRTFSMLLVVAGHSFYYPFATTGNYGNVGDILDFFRSYASIWVLPALLGVDTFFFLSGYLSMTLLNRAMEKALGDPRPRHILDDDGAADEENGAPTTTATAAATALPPLDELVDYSSAISPVASSQQQVATLRPTRQKPFHLVLPLLAMAYVNRYLRITPSMVIVIGIAAYLLPLWVTGPHSRMLINNDELSGCRANLWRAALYIQNFQPADVYQCMSLTWFLMVDMQIFVFIPVWVSLCYLFKRHVLCISRKNAEWVLVSIATAVTIAFYVVAVVDHPITTPIRQRQPYYRAMDRSVPYLVGVITSHLCTMETSVINTLKGSKSLSYLLNTIALVGGVVCWNIVWKMMREFFLTDPQKTFPDGDEATSWQNGGHVAYFLFTAVFWMPITLDAVAGGNKTWFTRFLSHPFFQVFSKLSFGLYLTHSLAIWMGYGSAREFVSFTRFGMLNAIGAAVSVTVFFAYILYVCVDRPIGKFCAFLGKVTGSKKKEMPKKNNVV